MKKLGILTGEDYESIIWQRDGGSIFFIADFDIDSDGGTNPDHDPDWNPDTSLHYHGKPIDAERVAGIVIPVWIVKAVKPIVLGCQAKATNLNTMSRYLAVIHDTGPLRKNGEGTPYLARKINIDPNSVHGGEDNPIILFEFWPGVPAVVDGIKYDLQPTP